MVKRLFFAITAVLVLVAGVYVIKATSGSSGDKAKLSNMKAEAEQLARKIGVIRSITPTRDGCEDSEVGLGGYHVCYYDAKITFSAAEGMDLSKKLESDGWKNVGDSFENDKYEYCFSLLQIIGQNEISVHCYRG